MRCIIYIIILFWPIYLKAQPINHEQIALDHFMEKIFDLKYKKVKAIEFSGFTEKVLTKARYLTRHIHRQCIKALVHRISPGHLLLIFFRFHQAL